MSQHAARSERPRSSQFMTASGTATRAKLVSGTAGAVPARLASRSSRDAGAGLGRLLPTGRGQRIPLPRTASRDIDVSSDSANQPIGAF